MSKERTNPVAVVSILREFGYCEDALIKAAFLHDVVEDTKITLPDILQIFGEEVELIVSEVTKKDDWYEGATRKIKKEHERLAIYTASRNGQLLKLADSIHNTVSLLKDYETTSYADRSLAATKTLQMHYMILYFTEKEKLYKAMTKIDNEEPMLIYAKTIIEGLL
tara:strand:+ start:357 stop:854 length:498 start_codon:yes stop_codon:yes gene_type:complete